MPGKRKESEQVNESGRVFPFLAPGIGTRIKHAAEIIGTRSKAAQAAGVSDDMLYRYIREQSPPSFSAMAGLTSSAGVSLEWLATGEGSPDQGAAPASLGAHSPDLEALEEIAMKVLSLLDQRRPDLSAKARARIVRLVYEFYIRQEKPMDEASLDNVIELAAFR
ncbi:MAG: helix-turn-helix transcriptional regulator [Phycisphaeraceae bacterium]